MRQLAWICNKQYKQLLFKNCHQILFGRHDNKDKSTGPSLSLGHKLQTAATAALCVTERSGVQPRCGSLSPTQTRLWPCAQTAIRSPGLPFNGLHPCNPCGQLRPTQPGHSFAGRCNDYWRWLWPLQGKKRWVLLTSVPCDQDCWHAGWSWLKVLAVNLSRPSGRHGL